MTFATDPDNPEGFAHTPPGTESQNFLLYPEGSTLDPTRPTVLEIGPGRGDFLLHMAALRPDHQFIAIEIRPKRFYKLIPRIERLGLKNVTLFCGDARIVLPRYFREKSLEEIHVQFPDPWPKRRHAKYRLLNNETLNHFLSFIKPGGVFHFATDVDWYAEEVSKLFKVRADCQSLFSPHPIQTGLESEFKTYFSEKWRQMGRTLYYQKYQKSP